MLKCDFGNLHREVERLEAGRAQILHMDVMDGHFVPNLSYGAVVIERIRDLTELPFEAHLMISDPGRYLNDFLKAGCNLITFHLEAVPKPQPLLTRIREQGALAGLAINPKTPVETLEPFLDSFDVALVMSVEPGFGGQKFIPSALGKLDWLRSRLKPGTFASVDGGIDLETIGKAAGSGANIFVVGSALFEAADYGQAIAQLADRARAPVGPR
jgi:ribulose-phosphate 3-epimerase